VKGERPIKTNRGLVREPILTNSILSRHYAYSENSARNPMPQARSTGLLGNPERRREKKTAGAWSNPPLLRKPG
jgi:hypothetical protein